MLIDHHKSHTTVINSTSPLRLCDYATHITSYKVLESHCYTIAWVCNTATLLRLKKIILLAPCNYESMRLIYIISLTSIASVAPLLNHIECWRVAAMQSPGLATLLRLKKIILLAPCDSATMRISFITSLTSIASVAPLLNDMKCWRAASMPLPGLATLRLCLE